MIYGEFVFVLYIEFTIDVLIRNLRITIILSKYNATPATIQLCTNVVNIKHFYGEIDHLITPTNCGFFLIFSYLQQQ